MVELAGNPKTLPGPQRVFDGSALIRRSARSETRYRRAMPINVSPERT